MYLIELLSDHFSVFPGTLNSSTDLQSNATFLRLLSASKHHVWTLNSTTQVKNEILNSPRPLTGTVGTSPKALPSLTANH